MGKSTISMATFNNYVKLPEGKNMAVMAVSELEHPYCAAALARSAG